MPVYDPFNPDTEAANVAPEASTTGVYDPFASAPEPQGFWGNVGNILSETGQNLAATYNRPGPSYQTTPGFYGSQATPPGAGGKIVRALGFGPQGDTPVQMLGDIAGGANKLLFEGIKGAYHAVTPDAAERALAYTAKTDPMLNLGLAALGKGKEYFDLFNRSYPQVGQKIIQLAQEHPDAIRDANALANISAFLPAAKVAGIATATSVKGGGSAAREAVNIASDIGYKIAGPMPADVVEGMSRRVIDEGINKTFLRRSSKRPAEWRSNAQDAMLGIVDNPQDFMVLDAAGKPRPMFFDDATGSYSVLPRNMEQTADAVSIGMEKTFQRYDKIMRSVDQQAPPLNYNSVIESLEGKLNPVTGKMEGGYLQEIQSSGLPSSSNIEKIILKEVAELKRRGGPKSLSAAQQDIARLNAKFKPYIDRKDHPIAQLYLRELKAIRQGVEKTIDDLSGMGPEYAALKRQYGAYREIEKDVIRSYLKAAGKSGDYVSDLTDVVSGSMLVKALMTGKTAVAATAITGREIAKFHKMMKDPNRNIRIMFDKLASLRRTRTPKSATGRAIQSTLNMQSLVPQSLPQNTLIW